MTRIARLIGFPVYWLFFRVFLFREEYKKLDKAVNDKEEGAQDTLADVETNTWKHVAVLYLIILEVITTFSDITILGQDSQLVLLGIIAAIVVGIATTMGVAWYVISFGAVPERYMDTAMRVTFWMFFAFCSSLVLMVEVAIVVSWGISKAVALWIFAIAIAAYISSILYDTMDLLKAGIDEASMKFYRVGARGMSQQPAMLQALQTQIELLEKLTENPPPDTSSDPSDPPGQ